MTDIRKALRDEVRALDDKIEALQAKREPLIAALAALTGNPRAGKRRTRVNSEVREAQVMDVLRANPGVEIAPVDVAAGSEVPVSTAHRILERFEERGVVQVVGQTDRGTPVVVYPADQPATDAAKEAAPAKPAEPNRRAPTNQTAQRVLDLLRREPNTKWSAWAIHKELGAPISSVAYVVDGLVSDKKVQDAGHTDRGAQLVRHRPSVVIPGEGVRDASA